MRYSYVAHGALLSGRHFKDVAIAAVVDGGHGPCKADTQEHVDRIAARDVADAGICILVLNSCHFTCERIWNESRRGRNSENLFRWVVFKCTVPGMLVPRATNTMAVTESLIPNVQPKCEATSPMMAVTTPIERMEITKHRYPPIKSARGRRVEKLEHWNLKWSPVSPRWTTCECLCDWKIGLVTCRGDECEDEFPEERQEVHNVVHAAGRWWFFVKIAVILVVIAWRELRKIIKNAFLKWKYVRSF